MIDLHAIIFHRAHTVSAASDLCACRVDRKQNAVCANKPYVCVTFRFRYGFTIDIVIISQSY